MNADDNSADTLLGFGARYDAVGPVMMALPVTEPRIILPRANDARNAGVDKNRITNCATEI